MAGVAEVRVAMRMENARADQVSEGAADEDVGREVITTRESSNGNRKSCAVGHDLYPRFRVFVRDDARHRPREHGVASGK